ncbi:MAG: hypothetical protein QOF59_2771 [Actinomycetota bacterium]|jgi:hypothetical protein|nr:hypothetical protein [Actinomycetota bacterium]
MKTRCLRAVGAFSVLVVVLLAGASPASSAGPAPTAGTAQPTSTPGVRPLTIQTVPAVANARFSLDGQILVTGEDGTVRTTTTKAQRDGLAVNIASHLSVTSPTLAIRQGVRAKFAGWYDGGYHYSRANKTGQVLRAAFDFDFLTSFSFVRPNGTKVQPVGLGGIQLHSEGGSTANVQNSGPVWLRGIKVASNAGHLGVNDVEYKVSSVKLNGNNVVHVDQQHFVPSHGQNVIVQLLLFDVTLTVRDAFFGFAQGSAIDLKYADGTVRHAPLRSGSVTFTDLPRGDYALKVHAPGLSSDKSVSISRNQTAKLQVITWIDLATLLGALLLLCAGLFLVARSLRHGRLASRKQTDDESNTLEERLLERSARTT